MRKVFVLALLGISTLFAGSTRAQTVNHGAFQGDNPRAVVAWTNPQAAGDTILATVYPLGGTLTDTAGDTFVQDCSNGSFAIMRATSINSSTANILTYTPPSSATVVVLMANEQVGHLQLDQCGSGIGVGTVFVTPTSPIAGSDIIYAALSSNQCCSGTSVSTGMTFLNGLADNWWGPSYYSGYETDAVGISLTQGVTFTYPSSLGGGAGSAIMAAYETQAPLSSITLGINTGSTAVYDDQTPILPGQIMISQLQSPNSVVGIGTITSDSAGNLTGSISINPNWVDTNGNVTLLYGLPIVPGIISQSWPIGQFQHNSTGLTINLTLFKQGPLAVKSQTIAVTP